MRPFTNRLVLAAAVLLFGIGGYAGAAGAESAPKALSGRRPLRLRLPSAPLPAGTGPSSLRGLALRESRARELYLPGKADPAGSARGIRPGDQLPGRGPSPGRPHRDPDRGAAGGQAGTRDQQRPTLEFFTPYVTLVHHEGKYLLFYNTTTYRLGRSSEGYMVCYAESDDGLNYRKPALGQVEFQGSRENNLVLGPGVCRYGDSRSCHLRGSQRRAGRAVQGHLPGRRRPGDGRAAAGRPSRVGDSGIA